MFATLRVNRTRPPLAETSKISLASLPLNSIESAPSWPSTTSLPSPGSHWNVSSPAPRKAVSLPCWPSTKSLPSPPSRTSAPLLPRSVSLPAPPSTVMPISAARLPVAENVSSPPLALRTRFSEVPMSIENGAGVMRSNRTRVPLAVVGELLGAVAAVDLHRVGVGTTLVEVGVVAGVPDHPVVAALAEDLVVGVAAGQRVVLAAAEQEVEAALAEQRVVAGLPEQLVVARAAGEDVVAGAAEQVGPRQRAVDLAEGDDVVAALAEDLDQRGVGDRGRAAHDGHRAAVHQDLAGCIAADGDVVVEGVAEDAERPVAERRRGRRVRRRAGRHEGGGGDGGPGEQPPGVFTCELHLGLSCSERAGVD